MIWQMHAPDEWRFGEMVRGVVREPYYAEIYFDEDKNPSWIWFVRSNPLQRGTANYFEMAIQETEKIMIEMGLIE